MKLKTFILVQIIVAVLFLFNNCSSPSFSQTAEKKEAPGVPVEVTRVEKGNISANYAGTTNLEAEADAVVVAKIGGVVEKIFVEEGDIVKKGQPLAKLEDVQFKLELAQAESLLKKLSNEYQRNEALFKNKIISKGTFDQIKFDHTTQKSSVDLARLKCEYAEIKAPFTAIVSERLIKVGNMVPQNQSTFRITGFNPLLAVLHVPEREMSKLKAGFPAKLQADALPGLEFKGKIVRISPVVDANTGTFKVTVEVRDDTMKLKPGMFTRVQIVYDTHRDTLLVPKDTILAEDTETWVFRVENKVASKVKVTTGYKNKTHVEVLSGLGAGDTVVSSGLATLKDSAKVDILN